MASSVMVGAGESCFSAYAIFLSAGTEQVSLPAALPSLPGSLSQAVSAWLAGRTAHRKHLILVGARLQILTWLPIICLPYFFPRHAVPLLISSVALYYGGADLAAPVWNSLTGALVPERQRGRFFGQRTRFTSIATFLAIMGASATLHELESGGRTRLTFTLIFSLAMLARAVSFCHLARIREPRRAPVPLALPPLAQLLPRLRHSRSSGLRRLSPC